LCGGGGWWWWWVMVVVVESEFSDRFGYSLRLALAKPNNNQQIPENPDLHVLLV
jgi:hypothetical protein